MYPYCWERSFSPQIEFLLAPWTVGLILVATGIILAVLWIKLRRWWKIIPCLVALSVVGLASIEPIKLHLKMSNAAEILGSGEWKNAQSKFVLREAPIKIEAFPISLGSKCNTGFIVRVEERQWDFEYTQPDSPTSHVYSEISDLLYSPYRLCTRRLGLLKKSRDEDTHSSCYHPLPAVEFFDISRTDSPGFEMRWCRELDYDHFYCEAEGAQVALAQGMHF